MLAFLIARALKVMLFKGWLLEGKIVPKEHIVNGDKTLL